jgi:cytochrome c-type protein NapB
MATSTSQRTSPARLLNVVLAAIIGASVVGFAVGTRQATVSHLAFRASDTTESGETVNPSQPYRELRRRRYGPSSEITSDLGRLRQGIPSPTDRVVRTEGQRDAALALRASRRAYDGAPPVIPHPTQQKSASACLACHLQGIRLEGRIAPVISHPQLTSCTQCHVTAVDDPRRAAVQTGNRFAGLPAPGPGTRAWRGAPPTIPHPIWMRQSCSSCHGVNGLDGIRTSHPERKSCVQCHASATDEVPRPPVP